MTQEPVHESADAVRREARTQTTTEPIELGLTEDELLDDRFHDLEGEGLDLADRQALRRVAGLATELQDVTEVEYRQLRLERVVLVGVWTSGTLADAENSMQELKALSETAGSVVLDGLIQRRDKPDAATF